MFQYKGYLIFLTVTVTVTVCSTAHSGDSPYFTRNHTWALSAELKQTAENRIYPRTAFLPSRYLLYIDDRNQTTDISGELYIKATTQDGVDVYVLSEHVSKRPFSKSIGTHEIIFNSAYQLCNTKPCDSPKQSNIIPVSRGDAFSIVDSDSGFVEVKGGKDEPVFGFITETKITQLIEQGLITRTDHKHPPYDITKYKMKSLSKKCGDVLTGYVDIVDDKLADIEFVVESFDLGNINGDQVVISNNAKYGGEGYALDFYNYAITDKETQEKFSVAAVYKIKCIVAQFKKAKRLYHESVTFKSSREVDAISMTIEEFGTPIKLRDLTGAPYLVSINEYSHFEAIMKKLSQKIGDRTLAGFALNELNVSCRFIERQIDGGICRSYGYDFKPL
jgi:hypothetical protein